MKIQNILNKIIVEIYNKSDVSYEYLPDTGRPGYVYRGVTEEEYKFIARTKTILSTGAFSFSQEGTCFTESPASAQSYATFGRDNPGRTGKPVYVLEIRRTDDMVEDKDGYIKSKIENGKRVPIPASNITQIWRFNPDGTVDNLK
jgi:hypothetical protein